MTRPPDAAPGKMPPVLDSLLDAGPIPVSPLTPDPALLLPYFEAARVAAADENELFAPVLADLGSDPELLATTGDLLRRAKHLGGARLCYEKALAVRPADSDVCFRLAGTLLGLRRIDEAMTRVLRFAASHGMASYELIDQICNEALWLGQHRSAAQFIAALVAVFAHAAGTDPGGYFVDAMLGYAGECDAELFRNLCRVYHRATGSEFRHVDQTCLPTNPEETDFLYASHCYAGTTALINLLLLLGVRVDEIGRRWDAELPVNEDLALRRYLAPPEDELPGRMLQRFFPLRRGIRCYSFSHRQPNPSLLAGRLTIFLLRDARSSITTWAKPTVNSVQLGTFRRFAQVRALDWCRYVDGLERIENRMLIRFEDWQRDPRAIASAIADRIGLSFRESQVQEAIHYSGTELSRQLRTANARLRNLPPPYRHNPEDPPVTPDRLQQEYGLIAEICGERLERYGYPRHLPPPAMPSQGGGAPSV